MNEPLKILILEDSATDVEILQRFLKKENLDFDSFVAMNKKVFLQAMDEFHPDIILADNSLPQFSAFEALDIIQKRYTFYHGNRHCV
jgi:PleD family two-component response regulator